MLRLLARRLDSEPLREAEEDWLWAHLESCPGCQQAQLMMVEAAAMYRLWGRA
jgi:predicted anti-sigma-YlaC factor YlaD